MTEIIYEPFQGRTFTRNDVNFVHGLLRTEGYHLSEDPQNSDRILLSLEGRTPLDRLLAGHVQREGPAHAPKGYRIVATGNDLKQFMERYAQAISLDPM